MVYERNKEHTILIEDQAIRAKVWDWFSNLRITVNMCLSLNAILLNNPPNTSQSQWAKDQIGKQFEAIKDFASKAEGLLKDLK